MEQQERQERLPDPSGHARVEVEASPLPAFSSRSSLPPSPSSSRPTTPLLLPDYFSSQPGSSQQHPHPASIPTITTTSHTPPTASSAASTPTTPKVNPPVSSSDRHDPEPGPGVNFPGASSAAASDSPRRSRPASTASSARQSRSSSPAPAPPLRTISQGPYSAATVNAIGSAVSALTPTERRQVTDSLRAHKRSSSLATLKTIASVSNPPPSRPREPSTATSASTSGQMPAPNAPPYRRAQTHRFTRTQSAAPPQTGRSIDANPSADPNLRQTASSEEYEKEQQRLKAAAAAKLAEEEAWEKTRGAGSAVLDLLKLPDLSDEDEQVTRSGLSDQLRPLSRASPGSGSGSGTSALSASGSGSGGNGPSNSPSTDGSSNSSPTGGSRPSKSKRKSSKFSGQWEAARVLPHLEDVQARHHDVLTVSSADKLLSRGISEYTLLPKILGRGKFSSVFLASKPHGPTGEPQLFAIKHTPLFPHHPLIATRLLREPTLLAELPPHPNLVNVYETIRTPGHFYLVEEYLNGYVTLEQLLPMRSEQSPPHHHILPTGVANCVLDQLLSAVHAIHHPLQICHRDIKPENVLVHPDTLQLKLLDFGLATHFSRSEAKLSTCCGSPAFHCPEIVTALRNPVGSVHYWGPEVDAWTCGITMLRLLTGVRYPIGASHTSVRSMSIRAQRAVATIDDPELRDRIGKLLEVNGERRMRNFEDMVKALEASTEEPQPRGVKDFKSTTFIPVEPQHKMNLPLVIGPAAEAALTSPLLPSGATPSVSKLSTPMNSRPTSPTFANADAPETHLSPAPSLLLSNPSCQPAQRVLSYVKYCLRCAGILYHCWPDTSSSVSLPSTPGPFEAAFQDYNNALPSGGSRTSEATPVSAHADGQLQASLSPSTPFPIQAARSERDPYSHIHVFECVLEIVDPPVDANDQEPQSLMQSIFSALSFGSRPANRRSLSTPPKAEHARPSGLPRPPGTPADAPVSGSGSASGKPGDVKCLTFYLVLRFPRRPAGQVKFVASRPSYSRSSSVASYSHRTRSRASSAAGADRDTGAFASDANADHRTRSNKLHSNHADLVSGIHPLRKAMIDSNHTTPRASRTSSPAVSHGDLKKREGSRAAHRDRRNGHDSEHSNLGLTIETSPELLRIADKQASAANSPSPRSAPNSRSTSRARSRKSSRVRAASASHRGSGSNKIFVHVTDHRALDAVRTAFSIGGTTTDYNPDVEMEYEDSGAGWPSPDPRRGDAAFSEELDRAIGGDALDHKHRRPQSNRRRAHSHHHASGLTAPATEVRHNTNAAFGQEEETSHSPRPTWADVPSGGMKPRSTISHGSDDQEQYTRGRSLGPAGNLNAVPSGIPFAAPPPRLRASSNLAFTVVQEESSPSNTERSASLSKTMLDLRDRPDETVCNQQDDATSSTDQLDLNKQVAIVISMTSELSTGDAIPRNEELLSAVSGIGEHLLYLQTQDVARFAQELDASSFDLFKALSPVTGIVDRSTGAPSQVSNLARQVLDLLGENASSREVYMAVDMRCGEMLEAASLCVDLADSEQLWSSAAEAIYLMHLLNTVLPRIRTKKPQGFSQVFARLPQCLMLGLASVAVHAKDAREQLAEAAVKTCCSTALICVDWEAHCTGSSEREPVRRASREALGRFLQGITVCLPYLAGSETALSVEYFFTQNPRYALAGKGQPSVVKRNESLFAEISKTLASLEVDVGSIWSNALVGMSRDPEAEDTRETLTALGVAGFVLHVHLLYSGYARDRPNEWTGVRAQTQLETALPVALLALSEQTKAAASPDLEEGKEDVLADTSLLWMQWCMQGLQDATQRLLPVELTVSLAQTLATQSVISPSPQARLIRFRLLTDLLIHRCDASVGLRVMEQLINGSPFAQLRAGGVSILRSWLAEWLSDEGRAETKSLVDLLRKVIVLPAKDNAATIAEESAKLTEVLSLLYWLETQSRSSTRVKEVHAELRTSVNEFVGPLETRLTQWSEEEGLKVDVLQMALQRVVACRTTSAGDD